MSSAVFGVGFMASCATGRVLLSHGGTDYRVSEYSGVSLLRIVWEIRLLQLSI
jgi:hypothetical protein